jgi:hypothetical protein
MDTLILSPRPFVYLMIDGGYGRRRRGAKHLSVAAKPTKD